MSTNPVSEAAKAVVRRNTDEVQGKGDFRVFDELFSDDFIDHTHPAWYHTRQGRRAQALYLRA